MIISIIAAVAENNVIGNKNKLPWQLPADLKHFQETTTGHCIIMGQNTHESIGRNLPGRTNIILTFDENYKSEGCIIVTSIEKALRVASAKKEPEVFIIGGASVYKQFIGVANKLYITKIHHNFDGDTFFPEIEPNKWKLISEEKHEKDENNPYPYNFEVYEKI
ncbi:MAG: Dihydrofolate reductase [Candidatus Woesebacteria bacterium GW2011_GWA1_39_21]|uniref:Dihydrofolate reductase n=1 Tax=Candidatus Woesebacteria bacterium GW2011_GWA1_39_21 TaxID=1618550 RepID=A0A0G0N588_9BACT|nr:MAG: Dihydrofolate reductase [Candidatus Woesebacteria bacterium GW2011_GWA1_39_21]